MDALRQDRRLPTARSRHGAAAVLALLAAGSSGCLSLSGFVSPEALPPGQLSVGLGVTAVEGGAMQRIHDPDDTDPPGLVFPLPQFGARVGLGGGLDVGVKFFTLVPWSVYGGDIRYQFRSTPFPVTAGFGASALLLDGDGGWAYYPSLMMGTTRLWGGYRGVFLRPDSPDLDPLTLSGIAIGTTFGQRFRLNPELDVYYFDGGVTAMIGLGLELRFGGGREGPDDG